MHFLAALVIVCVDVIVISSEPVLFVVVSLQCKC